MGENYTFLHVRGRCYADDRQPSSSLQNPIAPDSPFTFWYGISSQNTEQTSPVPGPFMSAFWTPALPEHARPGVHFITPQKTCVYLTPSFSCISALFPIQRGRGYIPAILQFRFSSLRSLGPSGDSSPLLQLSAASCRLSTS